MIDARAFFLKMLLTSLNGHQDLKELRDRDAVDMLRWLNNVRRLVLQGRGPNSWTDASVSVSEGVTEERLAVLGEWETKTLALIATLEKPDYEWTKEESDWLFRSPRFRPMYRHGGEPFSIDPITEEERHKYPMAAASINMILARDYKRHDV